MGNHRNRFPARRRFLKQSAALSAGAVAVSAPLLALGQASGEADAAAKPAQPAQPAAEPVQPARPARRRTAG